MNSVCDATTEGSGDTREDAAAAAGAAAAAADFVPGWSDHCDVGWPPTASLFPLIFSHATATLAAESKMMLGCSVRGTTLQQAPRTLRTRFEAHLTNILHKKSVSQKLQAAHQDAAQTPDTA